MHGRLALLLCAVLAVGSFAQNPVPAKSPFTVQGRVVPDPSAQPIRKGDVALTPRDARQSDPYSATSDAEGKFQIPSVKPGRYRVVLQRDGFLQTGDRRGTSLTLTSAQDAHDLVFHMQAGATISGKIVDGDGDPMANVSVQAVRAGSRTGRFARHQGYASTNDLGEYRIANLRAGKYLVFANADGRRPPKANDSDAAKANLGYVPTYYPGTIDKSQAVPLEVRAGEETPVTITPLASPTFSIIGTLAKASGSRVFTQLLLRSGDDGPVKDDVVVGEDGSFEIRELLPGSKPPI